MDCSEENNEDVPEVYWRSAHIPQSSAILLKVFSGVVESLQKAHNPYWLMVLWPQNMTRASIFLLMALTEMDVVKMDALVMEEAASSDFEHSSAAKDG